MALMPALFYKFLTQKFYFAIKCSLNALSAFCTYRFSYCFMFHRPNARFCLVRAFLFFNNQRRRLGNEKARHWINSGLTLVMVAEDI
jgi:uncharacterized PurR-regulated membrane protein YhhQ (DUF165 family)